MVLKKVVASSSKEHVNRVQVLLNADMLSAIARSADYATRLGPSPFSPKPCQPR